LAIDILGAGVGVLKSFEPEAEMKVGSCVPRPFSETVRNSGGIEMTRIEPYESVRDALSDLDNGGRMLSFAARAADERIDAAELAKAAGVFGGKQRMFLYFDMSVARLGESEATDVKARLSDKLARDYAQHGPNHGSKEDVIAHGNAGQPWIISGVPRPVGATSELTMFVFVPMSTGKITTMMPIPIIEQYEVYELDDGGSDVSLRVAHVRGEEQLPEVRTRIAGVLKEFSSDGAGKDAGLYLEAAYYTPIEDLGAS
jgi:hypothetical protein